MKRLLLAALLVLSACDEATPMKREDHESGDCYEVLFKNEQRAVVWTWVCKWRDPKDPNIVCYITEGTRENGISCLPRLHGDS